MGDRARMVALFGGRYEVSFQRWPHNEASFYPGHGTTYLFKAASGTEGWRALEELRPSLVKEGGVPVSFPASVRILDGAVNYDRPDAWVQRHPKETLLDRGQSMCKSVRKG
jgi:hypothetical protein